MENSEPAKPATVTPFPPAPRKPKDRDPKKVFVAMVLEDTLTRETGLFWEELAKNEVPGFDIVRSRLSGYGLAKCRNLMTWMAQETDCCRLVFVDSDMKPNVPMLARLLSHGEEMVSAIYPKKRADKLDWVGNWLGQGIRQDGLAEALDFGGGFCSIDLNFIDRMCEVYHEDTWFVCEDDPFKDKIMHDLWSNGRVVDEWRGKVYPRYLTEDFYICWRARKMGVSVWMDTLCQVGHVGPVDYLELHTRIKEMENQSIHRAPGA